jgi:hypothetical protein
MTTTRRSLLWLGVATLAAARAAAEAPWTLERLGALRRPHPAELEAEARLADAERALAGSAGLVREGVTVAVLAGPRRGDAGSASTDAALDLEVPILVARAEQRGLAAALATAAPVLRAAARAEAERAVALAALDAWRAREEEALREEEAATVEAWLAAARRRVEAGADPPYEATLIAGERDRVALELAAAREDARLAWGRLAALVDVPAEPGPLAAPSAVEGTVGAELDARFAAGALVRATVERAALARALAALEAAGERARWGLAGEAAREADEDVVRVGLTYRVPPRRKGAAIAALRAAREASAARAEALERADLRARLDAAGARLDAPPPGLAAPELAAATAALGARLTEGKDRPSTILPLRRQLLEARRAALAARHARLRAGVELRALTRGVEP